MKLEMYKLRKTILRIKFYLYRNKRLVKGSKKRVLIRLSRFLRSTTNVCKEVIQPQVPLRLPCYDFTPVANSTVVGCLLAVGSPPSGKINSHGVTGSVYKTRERIHRGMLIHDY